ncbi:MAG: bacteriohemerythrin [Magnetospiraceae bacterium]
MVGWDTDFEVGIESIDHQHRQLIDLANLVVAAVDEKKGAAVIDNTVKALVAYTEHHFRNEEALMQERKILNMQGHFEEHIRLAKDLDDIAQDNTDKERLARRVREWLVNELVPHILVIDKRTFKTGNAASAF